MREEKASTCLSTVPSDIILYQSTEKAPWFREQSKQGPIQEALFPQTPGTTDSETGGRVQKDVENVMLVHAHGPSQLRSLRLESQEGRG